MENNFIQMPASAGNTVAYTIGPIFKHIIDFVQLYFAKSNGFKSQLRGGQTTSALRVIMRSSKPGRKTSSPFMG